MRVAVITSPGGQDNLVIEERPDPRPGAGEVLVAVAYAGCNWADTMLRKGTYPHPTTYPLVPGFEVSGRVAEVGPDVEGVKEGDRVAAYVEHGGGYAERCVVGAESLIPLPDAVGPRCRGRLPDPGPDLLAHDPHDRCDEVGRYGARARHRRRRRALLHPDRRACRCPGDRHGRHARQGAPGARARGRRASSTAAKEDFVAAALA